MKKLFKVFLVVGLLVVYAFFFSFKVNASNEASHTHEYSESNGICECGAFEEASWNQHIDGGWVVENAGQLMWAVAKLNSSETQHNIIIKNDITLPDGVIWEPLGTTEVPFTKKIKTYMDNSCVIDLKTQTVTSSNYGLIGFASSSGVNVNNITVKGTFNIEAAVEGVGGIVGTTSNTISITNTISKVDINVLETGVSSNKIGGLVGKGLETVNIDKCSNFGTLNVNGVYESVGGLVGYLEKGTITNSINYANVTSNTTKYIGGIIGFVSDKMAGNIENVASLGKVEGKTFSISAGSNVVEMKPGDIVGYFDNNPTLTITNCYYLGDTAFGVSNQGNAFEAKKVTNEDITSGKLAHLLGNAFGQKIDDVIDGEARQEYPVVGSSIVYKVYQCDNTTIKYSNFNKNTDHLHKYHVEKNTIYETCENCDHNKKAELLAPSNLHYDKTLKKAVLSSDIEDFDLASIEIEYSAEVIFPGTYTASFTYQGLTASLEFEILKGIPTEDMFIYTAPSVDLVYDGNNKYLSLFSSNEPGMGEIVVEYFDGKNTIKNICDAGLYSTKVKVLEGKYYQAYAFEGFDLFNMIEIKPKEITLEWTKTILFYEEGKSVYTPEYVFKGTCYNDVPIVQFSDIGNGRGTFTTTIKITDDNYELVGDNLTVEFVVKGILVETPKLPFAILKNGLVQKPDIEDTALYKVVSNSGGTSAGKYPVVLELTDPSKYTWETTDDAQITIYYHIYAIQTSWINYPTIENWKYGEVGNRPVYELNNDYLDVYITYRHLNGEFSKEMPTEVGEYEVKLSAEVDDFRASPFEDVILRFTIEKANPICLIDSVLNVKYGVKLSDIDLLGFGEGEWSWKTDEDQVLDAGSYQLEVLFTPLNPKNYNTITKTITLNIDKLETKYTAPKAIDGLVYNNTNQALIIPGGTTSGMMYYKVNDGNWSLNIPLVKDAGTYTVYYKVIADKNYKDIEEQSITVKIEKTNITIKADNLSIEQYTSLPNLTYQIEGLLKEDAIEVNPTLKVNIENSNTFGNYEIVISDASSINYNITYINGTLTINEHLVCLGGSATCTTKAVCSICLQEYGTLEDHLYIDYKYNNDATTEKDGTVTAKCENCDTTHTKTLENTKIIITPQEEKTPTRLGLGILIGFISTSAVVVGLYFFLFKKKLNK